MGTIRYRVADSYYAKTKFVNGVREHGLHLVSKLRHDADLRRLYNGEQKAKGRPRQYAGKVRFDDLSRFELAGSVDGQRVYIALVNSPTFKCMPRIVYVVREEKGKTYTVLLFSTDLLERFSCHLALDFTAIKSSPGFAALCNYGAIAT